MFYEYSNLSLIQRYYILSFWFSLDSIGIYTRMDGSDLKDFYLSNEMEAQKVYNFLLLP